MKDLSLDIIKDNNYFIKSPFNAEVIRFFIKKDDFIEKNQIVALLKTDKAYVEIESEFFGTVKEICTDIDKKLNKWDTIAIVDVKDETDDSNIAVSVNSPDYSIIYAFQQEIFPKLVYSQTDMLIEGIDLEKEKFIHFLLKEVYDNNLMTIPFKSNQLNVYKELVANSIILVRIDWPELEGPLLNTRSYILIHPNSGKIQYFTCEKSFDGDLMISSIVATDGDLTRYSYGLAPENLLDEQNRVINIFISD